MDFTVLNPKRWQTLPRYPPLRHIRPTKKARAPRAIDGWETMDLAQLMEAADNGDCDAAWEVGDMYRQASHGVKYSPKAAFRWYAQSALAGSATGQNNIGAAYENGLGC